MPQHFTRSTISAEFWCSKCQKFTQHRIDDARKGPCLECIARLESQHTLSLAAKPVSPAQRSLWGEVF
jgi:ribosomal protein L44E